MYKRQALLSALNTIKLHAEAEKNDVLEQLQAALAENTRLNNQLTELQNLSLIHIYKHEPDLVMSQYTVLPMFHLGAFICLFSWAHAGWALNVSSDIRNFYKEVKRMPKMCIRDRMAATTAYAMGR